MAADLPVIGDLRTHALTYASDGLEVFPVAPHDDYERWPGDPEPQGNKAPLVSQYKATTDTDIVAGWWQRWPDALIGHRFAADEIALDIDPRHGGRDTWQALVAEGIIDATIATRSHYSGRNDGGGHLWFKRPAERLTITTLDEWARQRGTGHAIEHSDRWVSGLDLLQRMHRYTILPPSPHPDTGQPYRWRAYGAVLDVPPALAALLVDKAPPAKPFEPKPYDGDSIADWYTASASWTQILPIHGWTLRAGDGDSDGSQWRHPAATSPLSATTRHGNLFVYSPNTPFPVTAPGDKNGVTRFKAYTILEHRGDASAAARAARELKDGPPATRVSPPPADFRPPVTTVNPDGVETGDDGPVSLDNHLAGLPEFPLHALPAWMSEEAEAAADALQVPVEMTAFLGLMAVSIAVGGKVDVDAIEWRQPLNLYGSIVAPTGTGKSPAAERMLAPIRELERRMQVATREQVAYSEAMAQALANKVADAEKDLKADQSTSKIQLLADARAEANEHRVLSAYRMTVDDHTPEALAMTIASQVDERIAVVSPEGASLFETMTGRRYRDAAPNVPDIYLKAWGGEQITVDRVGRPALIIERPILSVCVMVQPEVISALTQYPMIVRQGGLARFLWVAARDIVGTRDRSRRRSAPPPSPVYADNLLKLGTWAAGLESPVVYTASEAAADIVDAITNEREARMGFGGDLEAHRAIEAKMAAYHWRLAGLLALAHDDRGDISVERVNAASELVDYFMAHAVAIHASAGLDDTGGGTWRRLAAWCTRHPGEPLDLKKAWGSLRSVYGSIADMRGDIEYLIALRWIKHTGGELDAIGVQSKANPTLEVDPRVA